MKNLPIAACLAALFASASPANAHIVLSQPTFEAGSRYAAFFKVEHGCGESPTVSLRVEIPDGVTVLQTPEKTGWTLTAERANNRIAAVTWRGKLETKSADQFGLFVTLPNRTGPLYFPTIQRCETGETRWTEIPAAGQTTRDVQRPAPMLQLTAAQAPAGAHIMAGNLMIEAPWSRATPPGAATGAAYLTITNRGAVPEMLTGGSSPAAAQLQIHQMSNAGGVMSMRPVQNIAIPAGGTVRIAPDAAYHLMFAGLKAPLIQGTRVTATLNFSRAGAVQVEFPVEAIGARAPAMDHTQH